MIGSRALAAELRKIATLPASLAALGVALPGSLALTVLNAVGVRQAIDSGRLDTVAFTSPLETAFAAIPLATVGAVILGVVAMGSEYTANSPDAGGGRQITSTLTATPQRLVALAAKAGALAVLVLAVAAVTIPACIAVARLIIGDTPPPDRLGDVVTRSLGAALYWTLTALIALALTTLARSGTVPLVLLIMNSSLVSVSLLLSRITPWAYYLPDAAGISLFAGEAWDGNALGPAPGGLVMAAWTLLLLVIAAAAFARRDA